MQFFCNITDTPDCVVGGRRIRLAINIKLEAQTWKDCYRKLKFEVTTKDLDSKNVNLMIEAWMLAHHRVGPPRHGFPQHRTAIRPPDSSITTVPTKSKNVSLDRSFLPWIFDRLIVYTNFLRSSHLWPRLQAICYLHLPFLNQLH